jgi:hypothetical protein
MKQGDRRDQRLGLVIIMKMDKDRPGLISPSHHQGPLFLKIQISLASFIYRNLHNKDLGRKEKAKYNGLMSFLKGRCLFTFTIHT